VHLVGFALLEGVLLWTFYMICQAAVLFKLTALDMVIIAVQLIALTAVGVGVFEFLRRASKRDGAFLLDFLRSLLDAQVVPAATSRGQAST